MKKIRSTLSAFIRDEDGATMIEYALLVALIAIVVAAALVTLGTPWLGLQSHRFTVSPLTSLIAERWLRAELLAQLRRYPEALGAYAAAADYSVDGLPYLAPSHLARAQICNRMGDRTCERTHIEAARLLWRDADREFHLP